MAYRGVAENAIDATAKQAYQEDVRGQVAAMHRSQAVLHFDLDRFVLEASDLLLTAMRYTHGEVIDRHHRLLVKLNVADTAEYTTF